MMSLEENARGLQSYYNSSREENHSLKQISWQRISRLKIQGSIRCPMLIQYLCAESASEGLDSCFRQSSPWTHVAAVPWKHFICMNESYLPCNSHLESQSQQESSTGSLWASCSEQRLQRWTLEATSEWSLRVRYHCDPYFLSACLNFPGPSNPAEPEEFSRAASHLEQRAHTLTHCNTHLDLHTQTFWRALGEILCSGILYLFMATFT